jgi:mannonate dehydratase
LGLYRHMLTPENFRFARQCACTHVIVHLVDYFHQGGKRSAKPAGGQPGRVGPRG